jgi:hypothetical protein
MKLKGMVICALLLALASISQAKEKQLEVVRVWPEKLLYGTKEPVQITVTLRNTMAAPQQADLFVTLVSDVNTKREVSRRSVTIPTGTTKVVVSTESHEEFGHEVQAVLMQNGREVSRGREFFTVCDHAPLVSQYSVHLPYAGSEKRLKEFEIPRIRNNYITMMELYFWSPASFGDFTPEGETWSSGELRHYNGNRAILRAYIQGLHAHGIKVLTYVNHAFWGNRAWEILSDHPERAMYLGNGQWYARFDYEETGGYDIGPENYLKSSVCMVSFIDPIVVEFGAQALVDGMKMFGYDGARWDGQWTVSGDYGKLDHFDVNGQLSPRYPESDEMATRNHLLTQKILRKENPDFISGYNYGVRMVEGAPINLPKFFSTSMGDNGWILWEGGLPMSQGLAPGLDTWPIVAKVIANDTRIVRDVGGELYLHVYSGSPVFNSYLCAITFANRAHLSSPKNLGHWYRFAIRYGGLLYDRKLRLAGDDVIKNINVQAEVPLWWKDTVYTRERPDGREQLILHLINPPANEKIVPKEKVAPAVRRNVRVTVPVPAGMSLVEASTMSPDPDTHGISLNAVVKNGQAVVTVPELAFWNIVVFEFEKESR